MGGKWKDHLERERERETMLERKHPFNATYEGTSRTLEIWFCMWGDNISRWCWSLLLIYVYVSFYVSRTTVKYLGGCAMRVMWVVMQVLCSGMFPWESKLLFFFSQQRFYNLNFYSLSIQAFENKCFINTRAKQLNTYVHLCELI